MITSFNDVYAELKEKGICKKLVVAWGVDDDCRHLRQERHGCE